MKRTLCTFGGASLLALLTFPHAAAATLAASATQVAPATYTDAGQRDSIAELISQARNEIAAGESNIAFDRLRQREHLHAGQPQYDYWLGVAAARSANWFESSIALQRVIQVAPRHAGARLELVAVYLQQGQLDLAELQLNTLQQLVDQGRAPDNATQAIARYQQILEQRRSGAAVANRLFSVGIDFGYDSNYLNYPDDFDLFENTLFEGLAVFDADDTSFVGLRANYWQQFDLRGNDFIEVIAGGSSRFNSDSAARDFNTHVVNAAVNLGQRYSGGEELKFGIETGSVLLDTSYYRSHLGFAVSHLQPLSSSQQWHNRAYFRSFKFEQSRFNFTAYGLESSWVNVLNRHWSLRLAAGADLEQTVNTPTRQGGDLTRLYASGRLTYRFANQQQLQGQLMLQNRRYDEQGFAVFNYGQAERRDDTTATYRLEWMAPVGQHMRINLFTQYRDQRSNVDFFELDQVMVQGGMTYVF